MRPTGALHLGHYHGVLKNWVRLQAEYPCFFFVADWHALTTHYETPEVIEESVWEMLIDWLAAGVLGDVTSVMDIGLMLGAAAAAGLSGEFRPTLRIPLRQIAASIIGGLLMGYGARIAYGCNIGAYFGGVASGSLHGWAWIVFALAGNWLGTWLRPSFGMAVERTAPTASC